MIRNINTKKSNIIQKDKNLSISLEKLVKNSPIDAARSMNTHIFTIFCNFAGGDSASRPPTRGRVGGRVEAAALSEPAKFQKIVKMWVFIDRVASEGQ